MSSRYSEKIADSLNKRHKKNKTFKIWGLVCVAFALSFLVLLFSSIISKGYSAFFATKIQLQVNLENINQGDKINYQKIIRKSIRDDFTAKGRANKKSAYQMISNNAQITLRKMIEKDASLIGKTHQIWFLASSDIDMYMKGKIARSDDNNFSRINDFQFKIIDRLQDENKIKKVFSLNIFKYADSRQPEMAGMAGGIVGSFLTIIIFLLFAFPIGVMSAIYLEKFAPQNLFTNILEITINNLAAIPSIIFGLLGLTIYINLFEVPRSSALVGGLTLFLLVLPTIIIATRNVIKTIPVSIESAAIGLGATKMQTVLHHILPLSIPGIMTGTILAISRAIGETAPLLMIGMVAFVADIPTGFTSPASLMPVQIYLWSDSPELGFAEKTSAGILILLAILISLNAIAVFIRKKFEVKW